MVSADGERELHLVPTIALATMPAVWQPDGDYLDIARAAGEGAAMRTFVFPAGEQSAQMVEMPADDDVVVDW